MGLIASLLALFGCDQQKVDEAMKKAKSVATDTWNSVKPDSQLFKGIEIGKSTEDDVRRQAGKPEIVWEEPGGGRRLEYPRGPEGATTWMVTTNADGTVRTIEQVLTAENFAKVRPGMNKDQIRRMLGKPTKVEAFRLKQEPDGPGLLQRAFQSRRDGHHDIAQRRPVEAAGRLARP
jgi:SmpA / OmlA family